MSSHFACDIRAIPADERPAHHGLTRRLMAIATTHETPDGFSFEFPASEYAAVARFVALERLCCPFLGFTVDVSADHGPLRLYLTGPAGVKPFIRAELGLRRGRVGSADPGAATEGPQGPRKSFRAPRGQPYGRVDDTNKRGRC
jgi:hypothetical protein